MPGRPPKPTAIHLLQGTAQKCRLKSREGELVLDASMPGPPACLSPAALVEWGRVTSLAKYAKVLTPADRASIAMYCGLYAEWEASMSPGGNPMQTSRMALMMNIAGKLGMNPSDRVRVHVPVEEKSTNRFAKLGS